MAFYVEDYANIRIVDCEFDHSIKSYGKNISKGWDKSLELNACFGKQIYDYDDGIAWV